MQQIELAVLDVGDRLDVEVNSTNALVSHLFKLIDEGLTPGRTGEIQLF